MDFEIGAMTIQDYGDVFALWENSEGVGLSDSDSREGIADFLEANPGLSLVARIDGRLVGAVLCGQDGRRGYIHHLAVSPSHRHRGIGGALVRRFLQELRAQGIAKCHLFVFQTNNEAAAFWESNGWVPRTELKTFSMNTAADEPADG